MEHCKTSFCKISKGIPFKQLAGLKTENLSSFLVSLSFRIISCVVPCVQWFCICISCKSARLIGSRLKYVWQQFVLSKVSMQPFHLLWINPKHVTNVTNFVHGFFNNWRKIIVSFSTQISMKSVCDGIKISYSFFFRSWIYLPTHLLIDSA